MRTKILVIDDEESLCEILQFNLRMEGYDVDTALSAEEALTMDLTQYNLFIVDIMMGKLSGFDFASRVLNMPGVEFTPIIFCSALVGEDEKVMGLNIGADDYITKPFNIPEVKARVRAVLRRANIQGKPMDTNTSAAAAPVQPVKPHLEENVTFGTLTLDRNKKNCTLDGHPVQLTRTEYDLLLFFLTHRARVYSREEIIDQVWGGDVVISNRTIDTNIARLRKKIAQYGNCIVTRQGFGYGFKGTE